MAAMAWLTLAFVSVAAVSWESVGLIRALALQLNLLDTPNERSSHSHPVPIGGGLALVLINLVAWGTLGLFHPFASPVISRHYTLTFLVGGLMIAGVSLLDDLRQVPCPVRLASRSLAAMVFIAGSAYWSTVSMPVVGVVVLGGPGAVLTFFWIVGLTNAYNFMDGIDGMAGGQAVAAGLGWVVLGLLAGQSFLMTAGTLLAASSLGFLIHNWHPATIFLGDVGSTFLGYSFAVLPLIAARTDPKLALAGILLVWPAIFDTSFTVLRRMCSRQNIFKGHRTFLFHRLVAAGWSHQAASLLYIPLPILGAVLACTWEKGTTPLHAAVIPPLLAGCIALWLLVRRAEIKLSAV